MDNLEDFFNIIGSEKKKKEEEKKRIIGEVSLTDLFAELSEEKKLLKQKKNTEKVTEKVTLNSLFIELAEEKKRENKLRKEKEEKLNNLQKEVNAFEAFLYKEDPKEEEVVEVVEEEEVVEIVEEEEVVENTIEEITEEPEVVEKSLEILSKLIPEEEKIEQETEMSRMKREVDQLRKMLYETIQKVEVQGGGGEVRMEFLDDIDRDSAKLDDKYLKYDSSLGKWVGADITPGPSTEYPSADETEITADTDLYTADNQSPSTPNTFAGLSDVDPSVLTDGRSVVYDQQSSRFIGSDILGSFRELISENVNDGDVIVYSASEGRFIATSQQNLTGAGRTTLVSLDDVNSIGINTNDVLYFNGIDFEFTTPFEIVDRSDGTNDDTLDYGGF